MIEVSIPEKAADSAALLAQLDESVFISIKGRVTWVLIFGHTVGFSLPRLANLTTTRRFISGRPLPNTNKAFPGRVDGLHPEMAYSGCEDSFAFQAGSYMYYCKWRNRLAEMAGLGSAEAVRTNPEKEGLPFVELIDFSDCEGVIGNRGKFPGPLTLACHYDGAGRISSARCGIWAPGMPRRSPKNS